MNNTFLKNNELAPAFSMKSNLKQMGKSGNMYSMDQRRASVPIDFSAVDSINERSESMQKTGLGPKNSSVIPVKKRFIRNRHQSIANNKIPSLMGHQRFNSELGNYPAKVHEGRESSPYIQARK